MNKFTKFADCRAVFIHSPQLQQYPYPPQCPFNTSRAGQTRKIVNSMGLLSGHRRREAAPSPADRAALEKFHTPDYLDALRDASQGLAGADARAMGLGTGDNPIFEGMYEYGALAAGASLMGAELIIAGEAEVAFNPSGGLHHAHPARASGFCYINDSALACGRLAEAGKRVAYIDIDAHHGDGVQEAFYDRSDVMTISLHQSGRTLFPGTGFEQEIGTGEGEGYSINIPMPIGVFDEAYLRAFEAVAAPLIGAFDPDAIVMELGMDALAGDPLTQMCLTNNAHAAVIERVLSFGRGVLAVGGGGYDIPNTVRGWALAWSVLCGDEDPGELRDGPPAIDDGLRNSVDAAVDAAIEKVKANVFSFHGL